MVNPKSNKPRVSVIMPVYNSARTLPSTLEALTRQTFMDWELVASDDGSSDRSIGIIQDWSTNSGIPAIVVTGDHGGPSAARNRAVARSRGRYLAFLDADDLWYPEKLEMQVVALDNSPTLLAIGCWVRPVNEFGRAIGSEIHFDWSPGALKSWAFLEGFGPGLCSSVMIRSENFRELEGFDERLTNLEDLDLALRLTRLGSVRSLPCVLLDYVRSPDQNHRAMSSVEDSVRVVMDKDSFFKDPACKKRMNTNLSLLKARRQWATGDRLAALRASLITWIASPINASRTILKRLAR